jgi:Ankyrin repeats (3 copies)/Ankyrin repeats (many copies)
MSARPGLSKEQQLAVALEREDSLQQVQDLLRDGGIDLTKRITSAGSVLLPPLHRACFLNKPDEARLLIEHGADVHEKAQSGCTAMYQAVSRGTKCIPALLAHGAAIDRVATPGSGSVLSFLSSNRYAREEDVHVLLEAGAQINARGGLFQQTPLMVASAVGCVAVVSALLQQPGLEIDAEDERGFTALMEARDPHIIQILLEAGADYTDHLLVGRLEATMSHDVRWAPKPIQVKRRYLRWLVLSPDAAGIPAQYQRDNRLAVTGKDDCQILELRNIRLSLLRADAWKRRRHLCIDRAMWRKPAAVSGTTGEGAKAANAGAGE